MTPQDIHTWLHNTEPPFTIKTIGGRSYEIHDRSNFWVPDPYPEMLCLALTGRGVIVIRMSTIESIHLEHETANSR
jgi:hypothetical protein